MIVTLEQSAPIGQNAFSQSAITLPVGGLHHVAQQRVHRAGHDLSRQHPDLAHRLAPRVVELACEPPPAQLDDGVLHDDIAGQLPRLAAIAMLVERMAEYAVHDQMQVIAHRFLERLLKPCHDARRVVYHASCIGRQRVARADARGSQLHLPQSQVEKAELEHELHAAFVDDVRAELVLPRCTLRLLLRDSSRIQHGATPYSSKSSNARRVPKRSRCTSSRYPIMEASWTEPTRSMIATMLPALRYPASTRSSIMPRSS